MEHDRAQELFSDHLEGRLDPALKTELHEHLVSCPACAALRAAFGEVVDALRAAPQVAEPKGLVDRVIEATRRLPRPSARPARMPLWMMAAAAGLAVALTAGVVWATRPESQASLARTWQRSERFAVYVAERKDRALEELRLLRVVVGTAFEGRLDRVNERVEDYRQLLEKRRASERSGEGEKNEDKKPAPQGRNFPNPGPKGPVNVSVGGGSRPAGTSRSTL
jgi:predicted anti-sigma-YlaC factor YlaD